MGAIEPLTNLPLTQRLDNVLVSLSAYLRKALYPSDLCVSYVNMKPHPAQTGYGIADSHCGLDCSFKRPAVSAADSLWLAMVCADDAPESGHRAGRSPDYVADRYTYVPLIGVFIILVELGREAERALHRPRWVISAGVGILLAYACLCHRQIDTWRNGVTLFTRAVEIDETNWLAQLGLGMALTERGRFDEALPHLRRAAELPGNQAEARRKLAIFAGAGRPLTARMGRERRLLARKLGQRL